MLQIVHIIEIKCCNSSGKGDTSLGPGLPTSSDVDILILCLFLFPLLIATAAFLLILIYKIEYPKATSIWLLVLPFACYGALIGLVAIFSCCCCSGAINGKGVRKRL